MKYLMAETLELIEDMQGEIIIENKFSKQILFDSFKETGGDKIADLNININENIIIILANKEKYKIEDTWNSMESYITNSGIYFILYGENKTIIIDIKLCENAHGMGIGGL